MFFVCILKKKQGLFPLANRAYRLNPLKSHACQKPHLQTNFSILSAMILYPKQVKDSCQLAAVPPWRAVSWEDHQCARESPVPHDFHPLPSRNLFLCVEKLVHFHAVSIVPASFTLLLLLSSSANFLAIMPCCLCDS